MNMRNHSKFIANLLIGVISILFLCSFMFFSEAGNRWAIPNSLILYKIDSTNFGINSQNVIKSIKNTAEEWSSFNTGIHFNYIYDGEIAQGKAMTTSQDRCSETFVAESLSKPNIVYAKSEPDPDCTGSVCTFIWICHDGDYQGIKHFDTQFNFSEYKWSINNESDKIDVVTATLHSLGHAAGLDHCSPGDTENDCLARSGSLIFSEPSIESVIYKFIDAGVVKKTPSENDLSGLKLLYGEISEKEKEMQTTMKTFIQKADSICNPYPCVLPEEETDLRYQLSAEEKAGLIFHNNMLEYTQTNTEEEKLITAKRSELQYLLAIYGSQKPAEEYMLNAIDKIHEIIPQVPSERLLAMRKMLVAQISQRAEVLNQLYNNLDTSYIRFTASELKVLIQIRREIINELEKR